MANNSKQCFNTHYQSHCHPTTKSLWLCSSVYCRPPHQSRRIWLVAAATNQKNLTKFQLQFQLPRVSTPIPTPTPGVSTPTPTPASLLNINSNSNSGSFNSNSNSNSGKSLEYQLQLQLWRPGSGGFNSNSNSGVDPNPGWSCCHWLKPSMTQSSQLTVGYRAMDAAWLFTIKGFCNNNLSNSLA